MFKRIMLAAVVAVGISHQSLAGFMDGNKLLERCQSDAGSSHNIYCLGYVAGIADVFGERGSVLHGHYRACMPPGATNGQLRDVVVKWLQQYPERRHYDADSLVAAALSRTFPCR